MPSLTNARASPKNHFPVPTQLLQSSRDEELASNYGDAEENNHLMDSVEVELQLKPKGFPAANAAFEGASNRSQNLNSAQIFDNPLASSSPQDHYP